MKRAEEFFAELTQVELADPPSLQDLKERRRHRLLQKVLAGSAAVLVSIAVLQAGLASLPLPGISLLEGGDRAVEQSMWEWMPVFPPSLGDAERQDFPLLTAWGNGILYVWSEKGEGWALTPGDRVWVRLPTAPTAFGPDTSTVWTGDEVLLWGVDETGARTGNAFDPEAGTWRMLPDDPLSQGLAAEAVWTGSELVVWGGIDHQPDLPPEGAAYSPGTNSWRHLAEAPVPARQLHGAIWAGDRVLVWGGTDLIGENLANGAEYEPGSDTWTSLPPAPLAGRTQPSMAWTGAEVLVWGGETNSGGAADGAAYNPETRAWRSLPAAPIDGRYWNTAVWTGANLVVWGGYDFSADQASFSDGASYDPAKDTWELLPMSPLSPRCLHTAAWTSRGMLVFGGTSRCGSPAPPLTDGALSIMDDYSEEP